MILLGKRFSSTFESSHVFLFRESMTLGFNLLQIDEVSLLVWELGISF